MYSIDVGKLFAAQPEYILGFGIYGRKSNYLHIETLCCNVFKKKFIDGTQRRQIKIEPLLAEGNHSKLTSTIGEFYCNLVSYKVMREIELGNLKSKYTFVHLPKNIKQEIVNEEVKEMLKGLIN